MEHLIEVQPREPPKLRNARFGEPRNAEGAVAHATDGVLFIGQK